MAGFDEAWLASYKQKRASQSTPKPAAHAPAQVIDTITLTLRRPSITLNQLMRLHWSCRGKVASALSDELARQLPHDMTGFPMQKAKVTLTRYSVQVIDDDNLRGAKLLIDCLLPNSGKHPHGLGLVIDDDPSHMLQTMQSVVVRKLKDQRTEIVIERVPI